MKVCVKHYDCEGYQKDCILVQEWAISFITCIVLPKALGKCTNETVDLLGLAG
jgi:hypothetical protein